MKNLRMEIFIVFEKSNLPAYTAYFGRERRQFFRFLKYFVKNYYFHFIFLIYYVIIERVNAKMVIFAVNSLVFAENNFL
jgi:hypothetical protein